MAAKEKLQIILDAIWRGKSAVTQADRDVDNLGGTVEKTSNAWGNLAKGAAVATGALVAIGGFAVTKMVGFHPNPKVSRPHLIRPSPS